MRPKEHGDRAANHDQQRGNHIGARQRLAEARGREHRVGHEVDRVQRADSNGGKGAKVTFSSHGHGYAIKAGAIVPIEWART